MEDPNFTKMAIDKNQNNIHLIPPSEHEPDLPNLNEIIEDENQKQSQIYLYLAKNKRFQIFFSKIKYI